MVDVIKDIKMFFVVSRKLLEAQVTNRKIGGDKARNVC